MAMSSLYKSISLMTSFFSFLGGIMLMLAAGYPDTGYALFKSKLFQIVNGNHMELFKFDIFGMIIPGAISCAFGLLMVILVLIISDATVSFNDIDLALKSKKSFIRSGNGLLMTLMGCACFTFIVGIYLIFHVLMLSSTLHTTKFLSFVDKFIFVKPGRFDDVFPDLDVPESLNALNRITYLATGIYLVSIFFYAATLLLSGIFSILFALSVKSQKLEITIEQKMTPPVIVPSANQTYIPNNIPQAPSTQIPVNVPVPTNDTINDSNSSPIRSEIESSIHDSQNQQPPIIQSQPRTVRPTPGQNRPAAPRQSVGRPGGEAARQGQPRGPSSSGAPPRQGGQPGNIAPRPGARAPPTAVNVSANPRGAQSGQPRGPPRPRT